MPISATDLDRKSGERSGGISVWMLFLGDVFGRSWRTRDLRYGNPSRNLRKISPGLVVLTITLGIRS
jgi:hypothetical protein